MKKFLLTAIAMMTTCMSLYAQNQVVNPQNQQEMAASSERVAKLQELLKKTPKTCGIKEVDNYTTDLVNAAKALVDNSDKLVAFNDRLAAVAQGTEGAEMPSIDEMDALAMSIKGEAKTVLAVKDGALGMTSAVTTLTNKLSNANALEKVKIAKQAANATKIVDFSKDVLPLVVEESTAQAKIVEDFVKMLK
ncbi:MAG: hypothetical protein K5778_07615 [Bacteroidaceae bacterium]|nr:hypothetical protein [Bacteroidaceae bacterium]